MNIARLVLISFFSVITLNLVHGTSLISLDYLNPKNSFFQVTSLINNTSPFQLPFKKKDILDAVRCNVDGDINHDILMATSSSIILCKNVGLYKSLNSTEIVSQGSYSHINTIGNDNHQSIFAFSNQQRKGILFSNRFKVGSPSWTQQEDVITLSDMEQSLKIKIGQVKKIKIRDTNQKSLEFVLLCTLLDSKQNVLIKILMYLDNKICLYFRSATALGHRTYTTLFSSENDIKLNYYDFQTSYFLVSDSQKVFSKESSISTIQEISEIFPYRESKENNIFVILLKENPFILHLKKDKDGAFTLIQITLRKAYQKYSQADSSQLHSCIPYYFLDFSGQESRNYFCQMSQSLRYIFEFPVQMTNKQASMIAPDEHELYGSIDLDVFQAESDIDMQNILYSSQIISIDHQPTKGQVFLFFSQKGLYLMENANPNFDDLWDTNFWFILMFYSFFMILIFGSIHFYCFGSKTLQNTGLLEDEAESSEGEQEDSQPQLNILPKRKTTI